MPQPKQGADVAPQVQVKTPTVTVFTDGKSQVLQIPKSHDEMNALIARRDQLSAQLESVTDRRDDLIDQMRTAPNVAMAGLQSQLSVLDARVLQLENGLATTGQEIAAASPQLVSMARARDDNEDSNGSFDDGVGAGVAGSVGVMAVILFVLFRRFRRSPRNRVPLMISADSERLQRVEQGMEAMAIEIERISEGQRFVTKLLSDSRSAEPTPR